MWGRITTVTPLVRGSYHVRSPSAATTRLNDHHQPPPMSYMRQPTPSTCRSLSPMIPTDSVNPHYYHSSCKPGPHHSVSLSYAQPRRPEFVVQDAGALAIVRSPRDDELRSRSIHRGISLQTSYRRSSRPVPDRAVLSANERQRPTVPPLALTKVVGKQLEDDTTKHRAGGTVRLMTTKKDEVISSTEEGGTLRRLAAKFGLTVMMGTTSSSRSRRLPAFTDEISPCSQPIRGEIRISSAIKGVYAEWICLALRSGWIEQCSSSAKDVHVTLKPRVVRRSDGSWRVSHDCSVVNAMATKEYTSTAGGQCSLSDLHRWSLGFEFIYRIELFWPWTSIDIEADQRKYYGFTDDQNWQFYRYLKMPKNAKGANRHVQACIKLIIDQLLLNKLPQNSIQFRGEEIYCGSNSSSEDAKKIGHICANALRKYGFVFITSSAEAKKISIGGLTHDRSQKCLVVPDHKITTIKKLVAELHTPRWASAADQLLSALHQIAIIMPMNWKKECNELRRIIQYQGNALKLLDPSVYLIWDELPRKSAAWFTPFLSQ